MYAGHLYNAVRQEKLLNTQWDHMKLFMLQDNFFVVDRPQAPDKYLKRFVLSLGASASTFAKNKRKQKIEESKKGSRVLEELAPISRMFQERYCKTGTRADIAPEDLETILSEGMWEGKEEESAEMPAADGRDLRVFAQNKQPSKEQCHRRRCFTHPRNSSKPSGIPSVARHLSSPSTTSKCTRFVGRSRALWSGSVVRA